MAPKKKKTKEEIEAEKARKAEEAKKVEEDRQRQEDEARKTAEQTERTRVQLLLDYEAAVDARLGHEQQELAAQLLQLQHARAVAEQEAAEVSNWQRYLACNPLPEPNQRPAMNSFLNSLAESNSTNLEDALQECVACFQLAKDCCQLAMELQMKATAGAAVATLAVGDTKQLAGNGPAPGHPEYNIEEMKEGADTAPELMQAAPSMQEEVVPAAGGRQFADEHVDDKGDVLLTTQQEQLQWGLWLNTHKNPRFKLIDFGGLGVTVEVNHQTTSLMVLPYPIPPAGADLTTWQPDEEPPPFIISLRLSSQLLVPAALHVGCNVKYNSTSGWLTFSTLHLGDLALLQDTTAALPYSSWSIRPAGGLGGACAILTLQVAAAAGDGDDQQVMLEVGKGTALLRSPQLPQLSHITNRALPLWQLLTLCEEAGLRLLPGPAEARVLGLHEKNEAVEGAMCADLAQICGAFLVASSRWNRAAGADAILVRLSEVTDWEEGGRIEPQHVARIFAKEKAAGPYGKPVFVVYRQGLKGVMLVDGGDNRPTSPPLPDFSTADGIQAASRGKFCQLHADLQHLLDGTDAQLSEELLEQHLSATAEGLELVRAAEPVFSYTMQQTMQALRLLTFG
eukprot:gene10277-10436_t